MDPQVFQVTPESFQTDVIELSQNLPVVVLFWAEQVEPSVQTKQLVEGLVTQYSGKIALGLSDVAVDQSLAQHLKVQGLPSLRIVHEGKIVEQVDGPADEAQLRTLFDALTASATDGIKAELDQVIAAGDWAAAVEMLQQSVNEEPTNQAFRVELADVLVRKGDLDDARTVIDSLVEDAPDRERPQNRLEFVEEAASMESLESIEAQLQDPDQDQAGDLELKYQYAVQLIVAERIEEGLEVAMGILQTDREFRDDIGRLTMIRVFAMLGKGDEMATKYRRKMFNFMH
ncbi:MAG: putative thioredoxin [Limisphaerales bacterium]|jgi:putative thioredoxin